MKKRSEVKRAHAQRERAREEQAKTPEFSIDVPNDPMNEQVLLAAACLDRDVRKRVLTFPAEAFYAEQHRAIHVALAELERRNLEYDPAVLQRLHPDVDMRIVEALTTARPDVPPNIDFHFDTLAWDYRRAQLARGPLAALLEGIQNGNEQPDRLKFLCRQVGDALDGAIGRSRFLRDSKEVVRQAMLALRQRVDGEAVYPFGIPSIDVYEEGMTDAKGRDIGGTPRLIPGAAPSTISMLTALSGSGKSTVAGHVILGQARQNRRVCVGAWEEDAPVTIELLTTLSLKWSRAAVLNGKTNRLGNGGPSLVPMTHEELVEFEERAHVIASRVQFFDNPFQRGTLRNGKRPTNDDHLDIIHEHLAESGAEFFIADLFARALVDDSPSDERHALFRMLAITQEQRVHSMLVHQQRAKDIEQRPDKRPTREGIIGSGAWLDVCWTVLAPHLPAKWKNVPDDTMEIYVLKQRNAPWPLAIEMDWNPDTGQISNGRSISVRASAESSDEGAAFPAQTKKGRRK